MASTRLTNETRRIIRDRMLEHGFAAREKALKDQEHVLAREVYDALHPKAVQDAMASLPNGYLDTDTDIVAHVDGQRHYLVYAPGVELREATNGASLSILGNTALGKKLIAHAKAKGLCESEKKKAQHEASGILASVSSLQKLLTVWPAVESFTTDIGATGRPVTALALPIKALNKALGLPPGAK